MIRKPRQSDCLKDLIPATVNKNLRHLRISLGNPGPSHAHYRDYESSILNQKVVLTPTSLFYIIYITFLHLERSEGTVVSLLAAILSSSRLASAARPVTLSSWL